MSHAVPLFFILVAFLCLGIGLYEVWRAGTLPSKSLDFFDAGDAADFWLSASVGAALLSLMAWTL